MSALGYATLVVTLVVVVASGWVANVWPNLVYHWSSPKFSAAWQNTLSVLVARGRAQVSVVVAMADWPKRIRDMRYADHEDRGAAD